jgi:hypothetical protein
MRITDPSSASSVSAQLPELFSQSASPSATKGQQKVVARPTLRGLMVDAARLPESLEYYRRVIEFCEDWGLNAIHFRLADDQGSVLRFTSVPGLLTHKNAFTPDQLKSLAEYAHRHGVDLIPELESFGHTGYITRTTAYAHLEDRQEDGVARFATGVIPVSPETLPLFERLYREVTAIFPSIYLHGGCDEVNWGGSTLSRNALKSKSRAQIWAEYLNSLNKISQSLGKQFIVWGDFVLHTEPEILGQLDKSIVIMDWNYSESNASKLHETFLKVQANGSRAIGAPALIHYRWGARAGEKQLQNIDAYTDAYLEIGGANSLGIILTNWAPSRYIQNSIWDGFAYAAVAFNEGTTAAKASAFRRFVEKHYRASWNETWSDVFKTIYDAAPRFGENPASSWTGLRLSVPWGNDDELVSLLKNGRPQSNPFPRLQSLLVQLEPAVMKNLSDFRAFELCVEYLEKMFWREEIVIGHVADNPLRRETTDLLIRGIAERDQALAEALTRDWDHGRFPDSPAKREAIFDLLPKDQLLFRWQLAADYSSYLADHPDRFYRLMGAASAVPNPD